jgi:hypothetical protein
MTPGSSFAINNLVFLSKRGQFNYETAQLSALPWVLRCALSALFMHILVGERAALSAARRVYETDTSAQARDFALTQIKDETEHVAFFENALGHLNINSTPHVALVELFGKVNEKSSFEELLVHTHLVIETLGHAGQRTSPFKSFSS